TENPYNYLPEEEANARVAELYEQPQAAPLQVLNQPKPNVLFVILESYTAKMVGCMGGAEGVTPALDALAKNGILFDNIYSSGDRSEKGLVALLSGYPVQTTTSIIKTPKKTEQLPHLAEVFKQNGYSTSFYYGGELAFANIKSYLLNAGYERLISKYDFPEESYNSKWGVHDHVLLERLMQDLSQEQKPFFSTVFTLSSHEPYEVPIQAKFPGADEATLFQNSCYYTDQAVGDFMEEAQKQPWWDNTLVVLVADHGHALPTYDPNYAPTKFRIPLIFTGGALTVRDTTIHTLGSQTDIATTLLTQLNLPHEQFKWGKNLLNPQAKPFAFYVFNDGFGWVTKEGVVTFDNV
ncbi:MAG: LTA synthase family protein, partial [Hymenobacteraceae bacterium]|nr:LTA synthase family protein [Hymenobacteraceae bacterium]